jgi:hypothetical protein
MRADRAIGAMLAAVLAVAGCASPPAPGAGGGPRRAPVIVEPAQIFNSEPVQSP